MNYDNVISMKLGIVILFLLFAVFAGDIVAGGSASAKEIPFTQDDRDRLLRLEEGQKAINQRIDDVNKSVNQRIDDLRGDVQGLRDLIYVVIGGIFVLIGFVIWDRRTALAPAIKKNRELEEKEERVERALREYAKKEPGMAEVLKEAGLL